MHTLAGGHEREGVKQTEKVHRGHREKGRGGGQSIHVVHVFDTRDMNLFATRRAFVGIRRLWHFKPVDAMILHTFSWAFQYVNAISYKLTVRCVTREREMSSELLDTWRRKADC